MNDYKKMSRAELIRRLDEFESLQAPGNSEERQKLALRVLEILNQSGDKFKIINDIIRLVKEYTRFEAFGIRLREGEDFPYYVTDGFCDDFVRAENYLCARDQAGEILRDTKGNPYVECMCGNILFGRTDPSLPFFTEGGSFWTNNTSLLLSSTSEEDRQGRTRNRCNSEGYESVALIPLRSAKGIVGLLQMNDTRPDRFTLDMIQFFERLAASISIAVTRWHEEEALMESEGHYRLLFDKMLSGFALIEAIYDEEGKPCDYNYLDINPAFESLIGISREAIVGKTILEVYPGVEKHWLHTYDKVVLTGEAAHIENYFREGDKYLDLIAYRIKQGQVAVIFNDVTHRKQAENALIKSEKKYRHLMEIAEEGIWVTDREVKMTFVNPKMAEILGYTVDEMIGKPIFYFIDEKDMEISRANLERRKQGNKEQLEFPLLHKDGKKVYAQVSTSPILDDKGEYGGLIALVTDITHRKKAEEEKEKLQAQLFSSQKLEAIGLLAGGVAHDFNNILTSIVCYGELAMMDLEEASPVFNSLLEINRLSGRAANLTRQLLLFSRQQAMDLKVIHPNSIIQDIIKMLHRLIGEDITIHTTLASDLWSVKGDVGNIDQVIMNLAVNARDAMPDGGRISIGTENVRLEKEDCRLIPEARPGDFVRLSFSDTGMGMDKETIQHIFEPFYTTKGFGKGSGLGLAVVYGIVKEHDGWINIYSEVGEGTVFKLYFPAFLGKVEEEPKKKVSLKSFAGKGERILLVEDEKTIRDLVSHVLRQNGYVVFPAKDAAEAIEIFEKEKGKFHLFFSDVVLPDKNGLQLLDKLRESSRKFKILLSSGYTDFKSQREIIEKRKLPFIQKPYSMTDLLQNIKAIMGKP